MATVYVYGASIDENGKAHGGQAGNQTGRELKKQKWYKHSKGWRVFRAKRAEVAAKIAQCVKAAVANRHIGYDQYQRNTLYDEAAKVGFDVSKVTTDCETDCSALVRVCCAFAGILGLPSDFRTGNMPKNLLKTGAFVELTGSRYIDTYTYLKAGDILVTATSGHTVVVGNDGPKAAAQTPAPAEEPSAGLSKGDYGSAVTAMQKLLLKWDPACLPKCGADGDFGGETERAVKDFQNTHDLPITGVYDKKTRELLTGMYGETKPAPVVEVVGGTVNVRSAPGTSGTRIIGVARKGEKYHYGGSAEMVDGRDWYLIDYKGREGWITSKFSRLVIA